MYHSNTNHHCTSRALLLCAMPKTVHGIASSLCHYNWLRVLKNDVEIVENNMVTSVVSSEQKDPAVHTSFSPKGPLMEFFVLTFYFILMVYC